MPTMQISNNELNLQSQDSRRLQHPQPGRQRRRAAEGVWSEPHGECSQDEEGEQLQ